MLLSVCLICRDNLRQWQQLADEQKDADDTKNVLLAIKDKIEIKNTNHKVKVANHKVEGDVKDTDETAEDEGATRETEEEDLQTDQTVRDRSDSVVAVASYETESTEDGNLVSDINTPSPES